MQRDLSSPYDRGYWARYDGKPRPTDPQEQVGWDDCADELQVDSQKRWDRIMNAGPVMHA